MNKKSFIVSELLEVFDESTNCDVQAKIQILGELQYMVKERQKDVIQEIEDLQHELAEAYDVCPCCGASSDSFEGYEITDEDTLEFLGFEVNQPIVVLQCNNCGYDMTER